MAALLAVNLLVLPFGCSGSQSTLDAAGVEAERVETLFWIMLGGAGAIWTLVIGTALYAIRLRPHPHGEAVGKWFLLAGGVAFPVIALAALLAWGLSLMSDLRAPGSDMRVTVSGERWWWRIGYTSPGGDGVVHTANEIRLPRGTRVELLLDSPEIIHSFWIPSLGGKMDMIPGRTNRLVLEPTRTGLFRGACAEFCGTSHALMAFSVRVMEPDAFNAWIAREAAPARAPETEVAKQGAALFHDVGCGACHTIRGTPARSRIGPDLTHLASRATLAAGALPMTKPSLERWIAEPDAVKPGARMPGFHALGAARIEVIAAYLMTLK